MQDWHPGRSSARVERLCARRRPLRRRRDGAMFGCAVAVKIVLEGGEVAFNNTRQLGIGGDAGGTKFTLNRRHDRSRQSRPRQLRTMYGSAGFVRFPILFGGRDAFRRATRLGPMRGACPVS
jgi:hypothetical protein